MMLIYKCERNTSQPHTKVQLVVGEVRHPILRKFHIRRRRLAEKLRSLLKSAAKRWHLASSPHRNLAAGNRANEAAPCERLFALLLYMICTTIVTEVMATG